jgi:hypothetical protein
MKTLMSLFLLITLSGAFAWSAPTSPEEVSSTSPTSREVVINITGAYIPGGFDSNSDTFVVVNGIFPNSCYKWERADVTNPGNNIHEVRSIAAVSQGMCLMMLVPFTREVHIGKLPSGNHKIRFIGGDGTYLEKDLVVE